MRIYSLIEDILFFHHYSSLLALTIAAFFYALHIHHTSLVFWLLNLLSASIFWWCRHYSFRLSCLIHTSDYSLRELVTTLFFSFLVKVPSRSRKYENIMFTSQSCLSHFVRACFFRWFSGYRYIFCVRNILCVWHNVCEEWAIVRVYFL